MSHGSLTDAVNASGQVRCTASWIDSMPGVEVFIAHGQVAERVRDDLLAALAVEPRVVQDAVVAGERAGDDRRVVRERDGGQRRHRAVPERGAHLDERGDVRRLAARGHVVEDVRVGAVEEEPDHVLGRPRVRRSSTSRRTSPSWPRGRCRRRRRVGREPRRWAIVGRDVDEAAGAGDHAVDCARPCRRSRTGARACTIPSEPCSPRWPPWSSQLCAAEWITQRSGAAG